MQEDFVSFLNNTYGSAFVATDHIIKILRSHGFTELKESTKWTLERSGKYYLVRDNVSLCAFVVGGKYEIGNGFTIAGSHVDHPSLKLKPHAFCVQEELHCVRLEYYGGGTWQSWFDRDLGVAGRIIIEEEGKRKSVAVSIKEPLYRIATCAIHLDRRYSKGMVINKETELPAIGLSENELMTLIAERMQLESKEKILAYDLYLCDTQPASLLGMNNEYVVGQGLDDLTCSYGNLAGLIEASESDVSEIPNILLSMFYDCEEIGSTCRRGAHSVFLPSIIDRISSCFATDRSEYIQMKEIGEQKSFILSIDVGHANHPTHGSHIEKNQKVIMNKGLYLESNCKVDLVCEKTDLVIVEDMAKKEQIPLQMNVKKQESGGGGSTIGPHIASFTGMRVIDMGIAMLSMHSIREVAGISDVDYLKRFVRYCFLHYHEYSDNL